MATIRILLVIICFAFAGSRDVPGRNLLRDRVIREPLPVRQRLVTIAVNEIGVCELSGKNDGEQIEAYLAITGLKKGSPWCASFLSWVYAKAGYLKPRSAWSPDLLPKYRLARSALPGDIFGIYFPELKRIAHVGMVERIDGDYCISIEGNTNSSGGNDGDGVYRKRRLLRSIYRIANWVDKEGRLQ